MTLRVLHTSDWHLGASLDRTPRREEHVRFLAWLLDTLRDDAIDVLVVAGDIFHHPHPGAEAQRLLFDFLARAAHESPLRQVVVIGGNHDSASRLEAPRPLLDALDVRVVGALPAPGQRAEVLVPVTDRDGVVEGVVVAVPYVHEYHLGVRIPGRSPTEIHNDFRDRFSALYEELAELAETRYPGVPIVATGHLTCGHARSREDDVVDIHQVGTIGALPPSIFDARFDYVALGHLHRSAHATDPRVWYSGTPIAMNAAEAEAGPRHVVRATVANGTPLSAPAAVEGRVLIEPIVVPTWRTLVTLRGTPGEVEARLAELSWDTDLPPFVYADLQVDHYVPGAELAVRRALESHSASDRPLLVRCAQSLPREANANGLCAAPVSLAARTPEEVFLLLHQGQRGAEPGADVLTAFRTLVSDAQAATDAQEV